MTRLAILTSPHASFPRILAAGLARMVRACGGTARVFPHGLSAVRREPEPGQGWRGVARRVRGAVRAARQRRLLADLRGCDAVVLVGAVPAAFLEDFLDDERVRDALPDVPLVLYSNYYLRTRGEWERWLRVGNPALGIPVGGQFGLERYDWYLCSSVASETPMPAGPQPYTRVGLNLDDGTLFPEQDGRFLALLDFERPDHPAERAVQVAALQAAGIPFRELRGRHSVPSIRWIYRRTAVYFLAHRESFGLPVCELQACGSLVFTPYARWAPSHTLKADLSAPGLGELPPNVVAYDNDPARLFEALARARAEFDPERVRCRLLRTQPEFYHGDLPAVHSFLAAVADGRIHGRLHRTHPPDPALAAAGFGP